MRDKIKYRDIQSVILDYKNARKLISRKQERFYKIAKNPNCDIFYVFDRFNKINEEIDRVIENYRRTLFAFERIKKEHFEIIKHYFLYNNKMENILNIMGFSKRTFFRKLENCVNSFFYYYNICLTKEKQNDKN